MNQFCQKKKSFILIQQHIFVHLFKNISPNNKMYLILKWARENVGQAIKIPVVEPD